MINDSVREELKAKVFLAKKSASFNIKGNLPMSIQNKQSSKIAEQSKSAGVETDTSEINSNPTSPTLIEFHSKNATVPEWRLQLQNTVRQRQERSNIEPGKKHSPVQKTKLVTNGATASKIETIEKAEESNNPRVKNPTLASALERIKESRLQFLKEEEEVTAMPVAAPPGISASNKNYPFYIAGKSGDAEPKKTSVNVSSNIPSKPKQVASLNDGVKHFDKNKLPPLPKSAKTATSFEKRQAAVVVEETKIEDKIEDKIKPAEAAKEKVKIETKIVEIEKAVPVEESEIEETDEYAPLAMRFNAGLFDLIIGSFSTLLLLSPFMLLGENWATLSGAAAFLAVCAVVMFVYLTTAVGMYGRTFGMRLFSLEIIDIEGEDYPTLHQAAVSSALYLASLALFGIGFVTLFFNDEKRAVHDIVSGTIVVKEF
jgi:uncharacterized RDD family membrane protein YckC